jgi:hypothetical protein
MKNPKPAKIKYPRTNDSYLTFIAVVQNPINNIRPATGLLVVTTTVTIVAMKNGSRWAKGRSIFAYKPIYCDRKKIIGLSVTNQNIAFPNYENNTAKV